jgi:hypothetical protein
MQWGRIHSYKAMMELNPTVYGIWRAHERASANIGLLLSSADVDGNNPSCLRQATGMTVYPFRTEVYFRSYPFVTDVEGIKTRTCYQDMRQQQQLAATDVPHLDTS